jgi:hypothetical protein
MNAMETIGTTERVQEQEKEIVNILIDSDLYLDMDLAERKRLLRFIETSYFCAAAK